MASVWSWASQTCTTSAPDHSSSSLEKHGRAQVLEVRHTASGTLSEKSDGWVQVLGCYFRLQGKGWNSSNGQRLLEKEGIARWVHYSHNAFGEGQRGHPAHEGRQMVGPLDQHIGLMKVMFNWCLTFWSLFFLPTVSAQFLLLLRNNRLWMTAPEWEQPAQTSYQRQRVLGPDSKNQPNTSFVCVDCFICVCCSNIPQGSFVCLSVLTGR